MAGVEPIEVGQPIDMSDRVIGLRRSDRRAEFVVSDPGRPPHHIDGLHVGLFTFAEGRMPPHRGELHPDGDEVLCVVSGVANVRLELPDGTRNVELGAGQAIVVPQGTWHLITPVQPGQMVNITPGPNQQHRPVS
ncbi:MAG TPA: cupin domain-containing protein [Acidimicrobiales bacterium]|jgi:quercetin dioxygenase-like cupin family protein|nr:cupin domain-containing protein [Acidimicrobiales bacterium]